MNCARVPFASQDRNTGRACLVGAFGRCNNDLACLIAVLRSRRGTGTIFFLIGAVLLFYSNDWLALRRGLVEVLSLLLHAIGLAPTVAGVYVSAGDHTFEITSDCTYVDWMLCTAPFFWRDDWKLSANFAWLLFVAFTASVVNLARVLWSIVATVRGLDWFWAHDLPDSILWYGGFAAVVRAWFVWSGWRVTSTPSHNLQ